MVSTLQSVFSTPVVISCSTQIVCLESQSKSSMVHCISEKSSMQLPTGLGVVDPEADDQQRGQGEDAQRPEETWRRHSSVSNADNPGNAGRQKRQGGGQLGD